MYKHCWRLLYGIFYIEVIDFALSQQKGLDKSVNVALETVFEFDKDGKSDIQLLNNVQKFISKVKNVLEQKHIERRQTGTDQRNVFTNYILNIVSVLNKFEDNDLERFFDIINNEIRRYCEKDDDFHILNKFGLVRNMPAYVLRPYLKTITNKIEEEAYFEDEKAVIDGVNYIIKQDDTTKFDEFINNLEEYRRKSRRNIDLVQVIKSALQNIFLDSYYRFKPTAKTVLRTILHHYFGSFMSLQTKYPVLRQSDSVRRTKLITAKKSRTLRQMYVEKNLDLKYPNDFILVTKKEKYNDETRTQRSRVMTVPTIRATKESRHRKGKKYGKVIEYGINFDTSIHTDNSDDEKTIYYYRRRSDKKNDEKSNQFKTLKHYHEDEEKYNAELNNFNKLTTFYLDLEKLSTTSYAQQRFDTSTHEYERPLVRPGFTTDIKHGKNWNSRQKVQISKHYGYIQKNRKDIFVNKHQMSTKKKDSQMARMPPISLNMQLNMNKEPSIIDNDMRETTLVNENVKNPLSEEGLSIEGFQETKRKIYNRRSDNHNDTANNNVLNLIQKIEQDLEEVKTKLNNVSVFNNYNNLDDIMKITENDVNKLKMGIHIDKKGDQGVINVRKFYEERDSYDVENKKKNYSSPDKMVLFESTGVNKTEPIYMAARKTIYDEKWYPVVRAREVNADEIIIQRKYEPLENALPKQNEQDSEQNIHFINNNISLSKEITYESLINEGNSITTVNIFNKEMKNEKLENTTITKVSANTKVYENGIYSKNDSNEKTLQPNLKDKAFDHNISTLKKNKHNYKTNDDKTLPNNITNVKLTGAQITNIGNTKENATKQNMLIEPDKRKDTPKLRSQMDEIDNIKNVALKETTTIKIDIKTALVTNYKNTTDSGVTVNSFITIKK